MPKLQIIIHIILCTKHGDTSGCISSANGDLDIIKEGLGPNNLLPEVNKTNL